ncbi:M23 family metallopeptidase [Nocardia sp. NPDC051463]|uniref:M23 family metallopeptidase n=1 Tax=Nocardia sp. NPDC051463 TaxID=3154845 RepID=UPI00344F8AFE
MNRISRAGPENTGQCVHAGRHWRRAVFVVIGVTALLGTTERSVVAAPAGQFGWPLQPRPSIERRFDQLEHDWLPGHRGVDLAGMAGQVVFAAGDGIVVFAGKVADKPVVSIDHSGGLRTTYEPVEPAVPVGSRVGRGTPIGKLEAGHEGCAVAACLHWGARREAGGRNRREYVDPLGLLHAVALRLKPMLHHG